MSQPLLGRCKSCDYALFVAPEQVEKIGEAQTLNQIKQRGIPYRVGYQVLARCDKGHQVFSLRKIEGTYSPDHKCDARCLNARGWKCTCSCGGANHGKGYAVTHVTHVDARSLGDALEDGRYEEIAEDRERREPKPERRFLGEIGKHIVGDVKVIRIYEGGSGTIYTFMTLDDTAKLTWFAPVYADPGFKEGEVLKIRAKVKRHEDDETYGKATIVTYVERVE